MGTLLVGAVVAGIVALIIRGIIRDKKSGKSHCGGDCNHCGGHSESKPLCNPPESYLITR